MQLPRCRRSPRLELPLQHRSLRPTDGTRARRRWPWKRWGAKSETRNQTSLTCPRRTRMSPQRNRADPRFRPGNTRQRHPHRRPFSRHHRNRTPSPTTLPLGKNARGSTRSPRQVLTGCDGAIRAMRRRLRMRFHSGAPKTKRDMLLQKTRSRQRRNSKEKCRGRLQMSVPTSRSGPEQGTPPCLGFQRAARLPPNCMACLLCEAHGQRKLLWIIPRCPQRQCAIKSWRTILRLRRENARLRQCLNRAR